MEANSREEINRQNNNKNIKHKKKKKNISITAYNTKLKYITHIIFLILLTVLLINIIIFMIIYYYPKKSIINIKNNKITCNPGYFIPNDNISLCLKCSVENCNKCYTVYACHHFLHQQLMLLHRKMQQH